jgi:hypothetical protein
MQRALTISFADSADLWKFGLDLTHCVSDGILTVKRRVTEDNGVRAAASIFGSRDPGSVAQEAGSAHADFVETAWFRSSATTQD